MVAAELPDEVKAMFGGLSETETPNVGGEADRDMVPEKPLMADKLIVAAPKELWGTMIDVGFVDMLKSTGPPTSHTCNSGPK
jgi:hypothetical protein